MQFFYGKRTKGNDSVIQAFREGRLVPITQGAEPLNNHINKNE